MNLLFHIFPVWLSVCQLQQKRKQLIFFAVSRQIRQFWLILDKPFFSKKILIFALDITLKTTMPNPSSLTVFKNLFPLCFKFDYMKVVYSPLPPSLLSNLTNASIARDEKKQSKTASLTSGYEYCSLSPMRSSLGYASRADILFIRFCASGLVFFLSKYRPNLSRDTSNKPNLKR